MSDKKDQKNTKAVTPEMIDKWINEHGEIFQIDVEDKTGFYKKPDRKTLGAAMKFGQNDPMKFNETLATNCWLGGDEELRKDDAYFMAAASKFGELVEVKEAEIKKLSAKQR